MRLRLSREIFADAVMAHRLLFAGDAARGLCRFVLSATCGDISLGSLERRSRMASNPKNRNALRSKRLLAQALSELLLELPYPKITVAAITRRADLNRGTFYAHYESVDDLMGELISGVMDKLFCVIDDVDETSFPRNPELRLKKVSEYLLEDLCLYRLLVASEESNIFLAGMKRRIAERIVPRVMAGCPEGCTHDEHVSVVFVSSGLVDVYVAWLRGEYGDIGIEEVTAAACALSKAALRGYA